MHATYEPHQGITRNVFYSELLTIFLLPIVNVLSKIKQKDEKMSKVIPTKKACEFS